MIRLVVFALAFLFLLAARSSELDSLITLLDDEMENKSKYEQLKMNRIQAILSFLQSPSLDKLERYRYNKILIGEYEKYSFDSTIFYIQANINLAHTLERQDLLNESRVSLGATLSNVGRRQEANDIFQTIDIGTLSEDQKIRFYDVQNFF